MKTKQIITLLAVALLKLGAGNAQTVPATAASQMISLSPGAAEVARLAQSGVGDDVILAYIGQSQGFYNLAAADIAVLKNDGVSSPAMTAMLNHDGSLRTRQAASTVSPPVSMPAVAPPPTTTQSAAVAPPATANATVVVQSAPPPPQVEVVPVSPGPDYLWAPGYWSWNGGVWIWIGGRWNYPAQPGHLWIGGYWGGHGRDHYWVGGHWR